MNEAETRAEHIDPALKAAGWGVVEGSRILRESRITLGRIEGQGRRGRALMADYVLLYRNQKLAVVEAKAWDEAISEGVAQAKNYAGKLEIRYTYSTNGQGIYRNIRRVLKPGGRFVFLTPNVWHPAILTSHVLPVAVKRAILKRTMGVDEDDIFPTFYRLNRRSLLASIGRQGSLSVEHLQTREFSPCTYADRFAAGRLLFRGYYNFMRTTGLGRHFGASIVGVFRKDTHPSREVSHGSAPA